MYSIGDDNTNRESPFDRGCIYGKGFNNPDAKKLVEVDSGTTLNV
jgi:hypothetical protein